MPRSSGKKERECNKRSHWADAPQLAICYPELEQRKVFKALPIVSGHALNLAVIVTNSAGTVGA